MSKREELTSTTLRVHLAPPLPARRFLFVCRSPDVKQMKDELRSRLKSIITEQIVTVKDGYELMDKDPVADLLSHMDIIVVHLASDYEARVSKSAVCASTKDEDSQAQFSEISTTNTADMGPRSVTISSVEHGDLNLAKRRKVRPSKIMFPVEQSYMVSKQQGSNEEDESSSDSASDTGAPTPKPLVHAAGITAYTTAQLDALPEVPTSKINVGDAVAFMVAELSADMVPGISAYRIGQVTAKANGTITIATLRDFADRPLATKQRSAKRRRKQLLFNQEGSGDAGEPQSLVGRWFCIDGEEGVVRYCGPVDGTKGTWLGVEWESPTRGKHSGTHNGKEYFVCRVPNRGSFIRHVARIDFGQSVLSAAKARYIADAEELTNVPKSIDGKRGKIEVVGFEKIAHEQGQLTSLDVLWLDGRRVFGVADADREETRKMLENVQTLVLARDYLTQWVQVEDVLRTMPNTHTLDLSANHFDAIPKSSEQLHVETLRIDSSPGLSWQDAANAANNLSAKSLSFGWSKLQEIVPVEIASVEELHLECNQITEFAILGGNLPHLKVLNLGNNESLKNIPEIKSGMFPCLHTLNLASTQIASWADINNLSRLPSLTALHLTNTPVISGDYNLARAQTIARLPQLEKLDGTVITPKEREEMERYYLAHCAKSIDASGDDLEATMAKQYPNIPELVRRHGLPAVASSAQPTTIKSRLVKVKLQVASDLGSAPKAEQNKSLLLTMQVRQLKPLLMRWAKIRKFRVYLRQDEQEQWIELDEETRNLEFYSISDGAAIRAVA
ncbi:hypothetical protein FBU59_000757 [Linderina macrospora]|uniref:Uncharacterized protein n=1 Tax=Linderina macrospora TaxID=4868 RepID=A0ACC1JFQ6_9FUNG|nr:hypothetical protein FBU59_000757 [Linderina macrospora]